MDSQRRADEQRQVAVMRRHSHAGGWWLVVAGYMVLRAGAGAVADERPVVSLSHGMNKNEFQVWDADKG